MRNGWGPLPQPRGVIDKPILELLTFGSNPDFSDFGVFCVCFAYVLRVLSCFAHVFVIFWVPREAALAADLITARKPVGGGCASSRLIHGFPRPDDGGWSFGLIRSCESSRFVCALSGDAIGQQKPGKFIVRFLSLIHISEPTRRS